MEVKITYEKEDWLKFQGYLEKELPRRERAAWDKVFVNLITWAFIGALAMFAFRQFEYFHWPTAGYVSAFAVIIFALFIRDLNRMKYVFAPSESGSFVGSHNFVFTELGIESNGAGYNAFHDWSTVREIVRNNGIIMLFLDTAYAYIFPEHKLDNPDAFYHYVKECNKQLSSDSGADAPPPAS
ncbi:MAG: hypothetical protein AB2792_18210 [Candidatus Thiodiazotropha sp.]